MTDRLDLLPAPARSVPGRYDRDLVEAVFTLGAELPIDELTVLDRDGVTARAAAAALWMVRLWGQQPGYGCLCLGVGGHLSPGGAYRFRRFQQAFTDWPASRHQLLGQAMAAAATADVYVGVLLRAQRSRCSGSSLPGRVAWADVDGAWTADRVAALGRLHAHDAVVWQVASGAGRHLYVPLDEPQPPERLEAWSRRLGALLAADAGWSQTKVLRLPGTFNHKPRAHGQPSAPVVWLP